VTGKMFKSKTGPRHTSGGLKSIKIGWSYSKYRLRRFTEHRVMYIAVLQLYVVRDDAKRTWPHDRSVNCTTNWLSISTWCQDDGKRRHW